MAFSGTSPLNSPSEFSIAHTGFSSIAVAGGEITYSASSVSFEDAILVSALSGNPTDNCYVGVEYASLSGPVAPPYYVAPCFIDSTSANNYVALFISQDNPLAASNCQIWVTIAGTTTKINFSSVLASFDGAPPSKYAINVSASVASLYGFVSGSWVLVGSVDCSAFFSTATFETWNAGLIIFGQDSVSNITVDQFFWGPSSDISGSIAVPNVVGDDTPTAESALAAANLTTGTITTVANAAPVGNVVSQSPTAGTLVVALAPVNLVVSAGLATGIVPNIINTSSTEVAPGILEAAGFTVGRITFVDSVLIIPGNVVTQFPTAGTVLPLGSPVSMQVSTGPGPVVVPYIIGDDTTDASDAILAVGLVVGAVGTRSSLTVPIGEVLAQNPQGGTPVSSGSVVSYTLSSGPAIPPPAFDWNATVISQFANSPTLLQLCSNVAGYLDQTANFAQFIEFIWNIDTAQGFGLDILGRIVNVSRLLQIPTSALYVGFQDGSSSGPGPGWDVQPFSAGGTWFTPVSATESYLLQDEPYRQLILTKALANILNTTVPAFNQLLQKLFPGRGNPYVTTSGVMEMEFVFDFALTPIELAILQQSGAVPVPPGVSFTIIVP